MTPFVQQSLYGLRQTLRISGQKYGKLSNFFEIFALFPCFYICLGRKLLEKMRI